MNGATSPIRKNLAAACFGTAGTGCRRRNRHRLSAAGGRGTRSPFATGCSRLPVDLVGIRCFIQIFDARLINKRPHCALPHLDRIAVHTTPPCPRSVPHLPHKNHHGSAVNLLLKIKRLSVGTLPACCCGVPSIVGSENRRDGPQGIGTHTPGKLRTYKLAWTHGANGRQSR